MADGQKQPGFEATIFDDSGAKEDDTKDGYQYTFAPDKIFHDAPIPTIDLTDDSGAGSSGGSSASSSEGSGSESAGESGGGKSDPGDKGGKSGGDTDESAPPPPPDRGVSVDDDRGTDSQDALDDSAQGASDNWFPGPEWDPTYFTWWR